jgi:hypothetical protein
MKSTVLLLAVFIYFMAGCASVPMESSEKSNLAKEFNPPSPDNAGVYVYRKDSQFGAALKKDIWIDKECIGETAKGVFFYHEVEGDKDHTLSTESEFSPNDLIIFMKSGMHYFVEQYIKFGAFVGGAGLKSVDEEAGKKELAALGMATKGTCNKQ